MISLGRTESGDLVDLLLECHERIRSFIRLAKHVGGRDEVPAPDVVEACQRCRRYFSDALPLHVDDEEISILPRLVGVTAVAPALETMKAQHAAHAPWLEQLTDSLQAVEIDPDDPLKRDRLLRVATQLTRDFDEHLSLEEKTIFPAIRSTLSHDQQLIVIRELRARRQ